MSLCPECGTSNPEPARFCNNCAATLALFEGLPLASSEFPRPTQGASSRPLTLRASAPTRRRADVLFVLDCSGSMRSTLEGLGDMIPEFAQILSDRRWGLRVGLLEFRDGSPGEEHRVHSFGAQVFTIDVTAFRAEVSLLQVDGGEDSAPRSSMDALLLALRQPFTPNAGKAIILVTDAPPRVPGKEAQSVEQVVDAVRAAGLDQLYLVTHLMDAGSQLYLKLLDATRGMAFEIGTSNESAERPTGWWLPPIAKSMVSFAGIRFR